MKYVDHILFRNTNPDLFKVPYVREAVGWIFGENSEALVICFDKPIEKLPSERLDFASGLLIVKKNILEKKRID